MIDTKIERIVLATDVGPGIYVGQVIARFTDFLPSLPIIALVHDLPPFRPDLAAGLDHHPAARAAVGAPL